MWASEEFDEFVECRGANNNNNKNARNVGLN